jgi:CRP-like cAMP-binding protein
VPQLDWLPQSIRKHSKLQVLPAGGALFRQGDRSTAIFEVEQGRLRLIRHTDRYHCDAEAADSRVHIYPKRALLAAFRSDAALGERFMAVLAHQIHALRSRLEERNIRSAPARVLNHLILAADADGCTVRLDGTLMDSRGRSACLTKCSPSPLITNPDFPQESPKRQFGMAGNSLSHSIDEQKRRGTCP